LFSSNQNPQYDTNAIDNVCKPSGFIMHSGNRNIRGHISKRGPSMLRFVLVTASHIAVKRSKKFEEITGLPSPE